MDGRKIQKPEASGLSRKGLLLNSYLHESLLSPSPFLAEKAD